MKTEHWIVLIFGVSVVAVAAFMEARAGAYKKQGCEITPEALKIGMNYPVIWLFYNDSEVNAREWADFGARSSRVINIPILNTFYETIVKANGDKYRVEVIGGVSGVAALLGEDSLPRSLKRAGAANTGAVGVAEEDWIRTAVLAKYGGLWLSPSVVALKGFGELPADKIVAFGEDDVPMYSSACPGFRALWVPKPAHPLMVEWEKIIKDRLENQLGGQQFRGDAKSDWMNMFAGKPDVAVSRKEELGRNKKTQKKLQLEDIFATWMNGAIPFEIPCDAVYLVVPYKDLLERTNFGWILRSSEEQILESELVISSILRNVRDLRKKKLS
jgi:hypothetical protein